MLLQVLDDGRLTDGQGRTVDFRNTLLVMTSNLGGEAFAAGAGDTAEERVMAAVRGHFRPEFVNRLDEIVVFHRLGREHMAGIVGIQLAGLRRLLADRGIALELDGAAAEWLADAGYDPAYGARPLQRVIRKELQNALAEAILGGEVRDGDAVTVSAGGDGLTFRTDRTDQEAA